MPGLSVSRAVGEWVAVTTPYGPIEIKRTRHGVHIIHPHELALVIEGDLDKGEWLALHVSRAREWAIEAPHDWDIQRGELCPES